MDRRLNNVTAQPESNHPLGLPFIAIQPTATDTQHFLYKSHELGKADYFIKEPRTNNDPYQSFNNNFNEICGEAILDEFELKTLDRTTVGFNGTAVIKMRTVEGSLDNISGEDPKVENLNDMSTALVALSLVGAGDHDIDATRNFGYILSTGSLSPTYKIVIIDLEHWFIGSWPNNIDEIEVSVENIKRLFPYKYKLSKIVLEKAIEKVKYLEVQKIMYSTSKKLESFYKDQNLDRSIIKEIVDQKIMFVERRKPKVKAAFGAVIANSPIWV